MKKKKNLLLLRTLSVLLVLLLLTGCGAPVEEPVDSTTGLTEEGTVPSSVTEETTEPEQAQATEPTQPPLTEPEATVPAQTDPTEPVQTAPYTPVELQPTQPAPTAPYYPEQPTETEPYYPVQTQPPQTEPYYPVQTQPPQTEPYYPVQTQPPQTEPYYPVQTQPPQTEPYYPVQTQPPQTEPPVQTQPPQTEPYYPVQTEPPVQTQPPQTEPPVQTPPVQLPSNSSFEVHFIDVGQADAALVLCDGRAMLIDGGNADDSSLMYTYLKNRGITQLDYVIGTHAHEDHIGGLAGALNYASVVTTYCPVTSYDTRAFRNFVSAAANHGSPITVPSVGDRFSLGSAECLIMGLDSYAEDPNNSSIVMKITYGQTSFLFTGDAEREAEDAILSRGYDLHADVLKVGHHGSSTSTSYYWLRQVAPSYAVISVGANNEYGHPTETVLSRLRDAEVTTFRTDLQGDIICTSDGQTVSFTVSRNPDADTLGGIGGNSTQNQGASGETQYVLNTNTRKFHYPSCSSAQKISSRNRQDYYGTREDLIAQGYDPCGNCNP